jgi:HAMP domain-containing protein
LTTAAALYHDPEEQQAVEALRRQARRLEALAAELAGIPGPGPSADAVVRAESMSQAVRDGHAAITRIQDVALREALEHRERISTVARRTALGILGALALSVAGGVLLAFVFSRWITAPLRSIAAASHRLATGDLSHRVEVRAGAELGETAGAFNTMADRIENLQKELHGRVRALEEALGQVKTLRGLLPMCAWCRKIRSDANYWQALESYVTEHADVSFTHGICPECRARSSMTR